MGRFIVLIELAQIRIGTITLTAIPKIKQTHALAPITSTLQKAAGHCSIVYVCPAIDTETNARTTLTIPLETFTTYKPVPAPSNFKFFNMPGKVELETNLFNPCSKKDQNQGVYEIPIHCRGMFNITPGSHLYGSFDFPAEKVLGSLIKNVFAALHKGDITYYRLLNLERGRFIYRENLDFLNNLNAENEIIYNFCTNYNINKMNIFISLIESLRSKLLNLDKSQSYILNWLLDPIQQNQLIEILNLLNNHEKIFQDTNEIFKKITVENLKGHDRSLEEKLIMESNLRNTLLTFYSIFTNHLTDIILKNILENNSLSIGIEKFLELALRNKDSIFLASVFVSLEELEDPDYTVELVEDDEIWGFSTESIITRSARFLERSTSTLISDITEPINLDSTITRHYAGVGTGAGIGVGAGANEGIDEETPLLAYKSLNEKLDDSYSKSSIESVSYIPESNQIDDLPYFNTGLTINSSDMDEGVGTSATYDTTSRTDDELIVGDEASTYITRPNINEDLSQNDSDTDSSYSDDDDDDSLI